MARAYRKKPVVVEAVQWTGENHAEMCEFIDPEVFEIKPKEGLIIHTLEGDHHASPGDYIIKGVNGEFYPCKPDIFAKTYESSTLTPPAEDNNVPAKALNEPLTLEVLAKSQLFQMLGEKVEVIRMGEMWQAEWATVRSFGDCKTDGGRLCCHELYGKTWIAYHRPPEEEI